MIDVLQINVATNERIERDFTPEEAAQRAEDEAAAQAADEQSAARAAALQAAVDHAKSLGFTDEMIAVMYPNLAQAI